MVRFVQVICINLTLFMYFATILKSVCRGKRLLATAIYHNVAILCLTCISICYRKVVSTRAYYHT